ncbi:hypothetical protein NECAME_10556 [Necator americanus]|uniref:Uncharacterized protein n=1 Tax=Necator americanus TaxID=51031 RepID=W2T8C4_NECAM|nr:hypothetical protein NECAME_10556 [Necator americanus]ETN78133.1 hypothetical protein NECAME_10556 [Necator americanus]
MEREKITKARLCQFHISAAEEESRKDEKVSQAIWMLQTGTWPSKPKEQINSWKALSHALSVQNGCLYFGHRIVVPASL